jgi:copper(I)-binding protein
MFRPVIALAIAVVLAGFTVAAPARAQQAGGKPIEVSHVWARATAAMGKTGAVYLTVVNKGTVDDRLVSAATDVAAKAELHETISDKGVMKMRPVPGLDIKAGATATLEPGKVHLMLTGLKAPLKVGQTFPVTLTFEKAGTLPVTVTVEKPGAAGMSGMDHAMPGMKM